MSDSPDMKVFPLRLPVELYARLERIAAVDRRSVNSTILLMLEQAIDARPGAIKIPPAPQVEESAPATV